MFDIGWSELVIIAVVALIAIGPKELPGVLRTVGNYMGKIRRMASEFQGQFQEAMREAEMADLKKQVDDITDVAKSYTEFDPLADVKKEIDSFSSDPLGTQQAATASPEAAAPSTPAPLSPDAGIEPAPGAAGAGAPQPQDTSHAALPSGQESAPVASAETKPASGSGA